MEREYPIQGKDREGQRARGLVTVGRKGRILTVFVIEIEVLIQFLFTDIIVVHDLK
jgi:hypothetical protein